MNTDSLMSCNDLLRSHLAAHVVHEEGGKLTCLGVSGGQGLTGAAGAKGKGRHSDLQSSSLLPLCPKRTLPCRGAHLPSAVRGVCESLWLTGHACRPTAAHPEATRTLRTCLSCSLQCSASCTPCAQPSASCPGRSGGPGSSSAAAQREVGTAHMSTGSILCSPVSLPCPL